MNWPFRSQQEENKEPTDLSKLLAQAVDKIEVNKQKILVKEEIKEKSLELLRNYFREDLDKNIKKNKKRETYQIESMNSIKTKVLSIFKLLSKNGICNVNILEREVISKWTLVYILHQIVQEGLVSLDLEDDHYSDASLMVCSNSNIY